MDTSTLLVPVKTTKLDRLLSKANLAEPFLKLQQLVVDIRTSCQQIKETKNTKINLYSRVGAVSESFSYAVGVLYQDHAQGEADLARREKQALSELVAQSKQMEELRKAFDVINARMREARDAQRASSAKIGKLDQDIGRLEWEAAQPSLLAAFDLRVRLRNERDAEDLKRMKQEVKTERNSLAQINAGLSSSQEEYDKLLDALSAAERSNQQLQNRSKALDQPDADAKIDPETYKTVMARWETVKTPVQSLIWWCGRLDELRTYEERWASCAELCCYVLLAVNNGSSFAGQPGVLAVLQAISKEVRTVMEWEQNPDDDFVRKLQKRLEIVDASLIRIQGEVKGATASGQMLDPVQF